MTIDAGEVTVDADGRDMSADAARLCDPMTPFDTPVPLPRTDTFIQTSAHLSPDELTVYFHGFLVTPDADIFMSHRRDMSEPFGAAIRLTSLNSTSNDAQPNISADGLTIIFASPRIANEGSHLYIATRKAISEEFNEPSLVSDINSSTLTDSESDPSIIDDGQELWFTSTRGETSPNRHIYRAVKAGSRFGAPIPVVGINSTGVDRRPTLSSDKLTIYITSNRVGSQGNDIWVSHRTSTTNDFSTPILVSELSTIGDERVSWLSPDNCRLYFDSNITGTDIIYVANRRPL